MRSISTMLSVENVEHRVDSMKISCASTVEPLVSAAMEHWELVEEMPHVEQLSTQDRLQLAKRRRAHQLKVFLMKDREWSRMAAASHDSKRKKRHVKFKHNVVLLEAAARNDIEEVERLLSRNVNPDSANEDGLTALHQCCIDDNEAMLQLLLKYGANVNAKDSEKWTPLHAAATCGHLRLVKILVSKGADVLAVNADGNMPYDICEDEKTLDYIENEMAQKGITQKIIDDTRGETERQMLADMKKFDKQGQDLNKVDHQGATPLHIAAANGYLSVVKYLIEKKVNLEVRDRDDWTPAHAAACWGHVEVLELLVQAGADLTARNKHDETPADICEDPDLRQRIQDLRSEQELRADKKKIGRSGSNTRTQSVRRTSIRDKTLSAKKDAADEKMRLQSQNQVSIKSSLRSNTSMTSVKPLSSTSAIRKIRESPDGQASSTTSLSKVPLSATPALGAKNSEEKSVTIADTNGKLNVTVFVTINGTLADLKKQRAQIRSGGGGDSFSGSFDELLQSQRESDAVSDPSLPPSPSSPGSSQILPSHNHPLNSVGPTASASIQTVSVVPSVTQTPSVKLSLTQLPPAPEPSTTSIQRYAGTTENISVDEKKQKKCCILM